MCFIYTIQILKRFFFSIANTFWQHKEQLKKQNIGGIFIPQLSLQIKVVAAVEVAVADGFHDVVLADGDA